MNKAFIIGRLVKTPELKTTQSGISVCNFTVAVNRAYKDQNGGRQVDFIPVVVWRGQAENCAKYLDKGSKVAVAGEIQTRSYDKNGEKRYVTEIIASDVEFLTTQSTSENAQNNGDSGFSGFEPVSESDMPF